MPRNALPDQIAQEPVILDPAESLPEPPESRWRMRALLGRVAPSIAAGLVLAIVSVAVFGHHVYHGGFYADDWLDLANYHFAAHDGFWSAFSKFQQPNRPVGALFFTVKAALLGQHYKANLAATLALAVLASWALYVALRGLKVAWFHAVAIAILVLLFPMSDSIRLWATGGVISLVNACYFLGVALMAREERQPDRSFGLRSVLLHLPVTALFTFGILGYEVILIPVVFAWTLFVPRFGLRGAAWRGAMDVCGAALVLVVFSSDQPAAHAETLRAAWNSARDFAPSAAAVLGRSIAPDRGVPAYGAVWIGLLVLGIILAFTRVAPRSDERRMSILRWSGFALLGLVFAAAAYVPYVLVFYVPFQDGIFNRTNNLASVGIVCAIYGVLVGISKVAGLVVRRRRLGVVAERAVLVVLVCVLSSAYVTSVKADAVRWDHAADVQARDLHVMAQLSGTPVHDSVTYRYGSFAYSAPGIPIFGAGGAFDLPSAWKLYWNDPTIRAYPVLSSTPMECHADHMSLVGLGLDEVSPYGNGYLVDVAKGLSLRPRSQAECIAANQQLTPGEMNEYDPGPAVL